MRGNVFAALLGFTIMTAVGCGETAQQVPETPAPPTVDLGDPAEPAPGEQKPVDETPVLPIPDETTTTEEPAPATVKPIPDEASAN